jgi:hypothetical protein
MLPQEGDTTFEALSAALVSSGRYGGLAQPRDFKSR